MASGKKEAGDPLVLPEGANARIGLALGSGSARGWAHIGVIRALADMGIEPDIVAGTSIGAIVGAAYACNQVDALEEWTRALSWKGMITYLDLSLMAGGFIQGEKLINFARPHVKDTCIENLPRRLGVVATELESGREIWFRDGPLLDAVRASISLPGLFAPVKLEGRWLVDGGLANPVPVSLCRAMGADVVIAVNLNGDIVGKRKRQRETTHEKPHISKTEEADLWEKLTAQFKSSLNERKDSLITQLFGENHEAPGIFNVMASSINIMQDRITRSRMAGDPPEIMLTPRLSHLGLMEFDQAAMAIEEGRASVARMRPVLEQAIKEL